MPNQTPEQWTMSSRSPVCGSGACVNVEKVDGGVLVTSTIDGNEGYVLFTQDEWTGFVEQVKLGKWDHTL